MKSTIKTVTWKHKMLPFAAAFALLGTRTASADYHSTILADHPAAFYEMQEAPGAGTAVDSSGNGYNGGINYDLDINSIPDYPVLGVPGVDTNAYVFQPIPTPILQAHVSYVDVANNAALNPQGPFSVEFWARATSDKGGPNNYTVPVGSVGG